MRDGASRGDADGGALWRESGAGIEEPFPSLCGGVEPGLEDADSKADRGRVFPSRQLSLWSWKNAVGHHLEQLAREMPYGDRRAGLLRRATAFRLCGSRTRVQACGACGEAQAGSGETCPPEDGYPCGARTCPFCSRRDAQTLHLDLAAAVAQVPALSQARAEAKAAELSADLAKREARLVAQTTDYLRDLVRQGIRRVKKSLRETRRLGEYAWHFLTLTVEYSPWDPVEMTVEALRGRARGLMAAMKHVWNAGLNRAGLGLNALFTKLELSTKGFVHLHAMYWGPFVPKQWLEEEARKAYSACGFSWIVAVDADDDGGCLREVTKYSTKSVGPLSEGWLAGEKREAIHPELAARWEAATDGEDLYRRYGVLRDVPAGDEPPRDEEPAGPSACVACGAIGELVPRYVPTRRFVRDCHAKGLRALKRSKWKPPEAVRRSGVWDRFT